MTVDHFRTRQIRQQEEAQENDRMLLEDLVFYVREASEQLESAVRKYEAMRRRRLSKTRDPGKRERIRAHAAHKIGEATRQTREWIQDIMLEYERVKANNAKHIFIGDLLI
jgi:hypothetical protein